MTIHQIDYDLRSDRYDELHDTIESIGSGTHLLESTWLVDAETDSAGDIPDDLKDVLRNDDKLFVARIDGSGWSWATNFSDESTEWLKEHIA